VPALMSKIDKWGPALPRRATHGSGSVGLSRRALLSRLRGFSGRLKGPRGQNASLPAWRLPAGASASRRLPCWFVRRTIPSGAPGREGSLRKIDDWHRSREKPQTAPRPWSFCLLPAGLPFPWKPLAPAGAVGRTIGAARAPFTIGAEQFLLALARHTDSAADPAERTWVLGRGRSRPHPGFRGGWPRRYSLLKPSEPARKALPAAAQRHRNISIPPTRPSTSCAAWIGFVDWARGASRSSPFQLPLGPLLSGNGALLL